MATAAPLESASAERRTAFLLLLTMAVCWGGTWPAGKLAVEEVPPAVLATVRFALSSAMLWIWTRALAKPLPRPTRSDLPLVLALGLTAVAGYNLLFLYGLTLAPASDGAIIVPGLAPLMTGVIGGLFGYYAIGLACGGTDVSEASDHGFCDLYPGGAKLLWSLTAVAPLVGGASGRPGWLLAGALTAAGALLLMAAVFAAV